MTRVADFPNLYRHDNGVYYVRWQMQHRIIQFSLRTKQLALAKTAYKQVYLNTLHDVLSGQNKILKQRIAKEKRTKLEAALSDWLKAAALKKESAGGIRQKRYLRNKLLDLKTRFVDEIDQEYVRKFDQTCLKLDLAQNTRLTMQKVFRAFLHFCISKGYYTDEAFKKIDWPVVRYKKRLEGAIIKPEDYQRIIDHPDIRKNDFRRMYLMALWEFGTRPKAEGLRIAYKDVNWTERTIRIYQSKTEKSTDNNLKWIPVSKDFILELRAYCDRNKITSGLLFRSKKDNPAYWLSKHWLRVLEESRISEPYTLYSFRHTFATRLYRLTKDIEFVRAVMGHTTLVHTIKYLHTYAPDLTATLDKALALEKKRKKKTS